MDSIYQNCIFNIAAAHGKEPSSGCFVTREFALVTPLLFKLRAASYVTRQDFQGWVREETSSSYIAEEFSRRSDIRHNNISSFHLDSRGWVTQERLLSRRVLHFASEQIF